MKLATKISILKVVTWLALTISVGLGGWTLYDVAVKNERAHAAK